MVARRPKGSNAPTWGEFVRRSWFFAVVTALSLTAAGCEREGAVASSEPPTVSPVATADDNAIDLPTYEGEIEWRLYHLHGPLIAEDAASEPCV